MCDHCHYFKPIHDEEDSMDFFGWCERHQTDVDRTLFCDDFHCWRVGPSPDGPNGT